MPSAGSGHDRYRVDPSEGRTAAHLARLIPAGDIDGQRNLRAPIYQPIE